MRKEKEELRVTPKPPVWVETGALVPARASQGTQKARFKVFQVSKHSRRTVETHWALAHRIGLLFVQRVS